MEMTECSCDRPARPVVQVARAKSFEGYMVMEGDRVVAVALSKAEAEELIRKLGQEDAPTFDD